MSIPRCMAFSAALAVSSLAFIGAASAQQCPVAGKVDDGYTLHLTNEEMFKVDRIVDDVAYVRHLDNRGNTLDSQELYRGLFTLATVGGKGRTVYSYDVDPATFFPISSEGNATVGGVMIPESGRSSRVERWWRISGAGTKKLDSGKDREFLCIYNVKTVEATTTWPDLGLEFRQEKLWSDTLNMVLYLKTEVWERGVQTRVTVYDVDWIEE
jgi:hypothetical protein